MLSKAFSGVHFPHHPPFHHDRLTHSRHLPYFAAPATPASASSVAAADPVATVQHRWAAAVGG